MAAAKPLADRLWARVERPSETDCWTWQGPKTNGYGVIGLGGRGGATVRTHRVAYELLIGPIPDGLHLDHLCRNRACCNPAHLEPVPQSENNRRAGEAKTHCPYGHPLPPHGVKRRACKTCKSDYDRQHYAEKKEQR